MPVGIIPAVRLTRYLWVMTFGMWVPVAIVFLVPGMQLGPNNRFAGDFSFFYLLGELVRRGQTLDLYSESALLSLGREVLPQLGDLHYPNAYPPQVALAFSWLALPYDAAMAVFLLATAALYGACIFAFWRTSSHLRAYGAGVTAGALAYPAFFFLILFGQSTVPALASVTGTYLAMRAGRQWLAGFCIGLIAYKPQLALGLGLVLVLAGQWRVIIGAVCGVVLETAVTWAIVGTDVMRQYVAALRDSERLLRHLEPRLAQLHSLRSFFDLLVPWPLVSLTAYIACSIAAVLLARRVWLSGAPLSLRFASLLVTTVLVDPHLNVYDLVILAPAFLLVSDWALASPAPAAASERKTLNVLLIASYLLPILFPLTAVTRVQLSVLTFAGLAIVLARNAAADTARGRASG